MEWRILDLTTGGTLKIGRYPWLLHASAEWERLVLVLGLGVPLLRGPQHEVMVIAFPAREVQKRYIGLY